LDHPVITANAFSTANDVEEMLAAVKFLRQIAAQPTLARLITEELRPGPEVVTDEALIEDFRARSGTVYHPSCTCRMGRGWHQIRWWMRGCGCMASAVCG
jgi:choline dehydrogenase